MNVTEKIIGIKTFVYQSREDCVFLSVDLMFPSYSMVKHLILCENHFVVVL